MEYRNKIFNMDCIAGMQLLPDGCVDMVLTDLPYGITGCRWDTVSAYSSGGGSSSATYTITATAGTGGDISTGKYVSVGAGESAGFTFTPSKGYQIADVLINGKRIGAKNSYAFTNVRSNQTIHVTFKVANSHANPQTNVTVTDGKKNH